MNQACERERERATKREPFLFISISNLDGSSKLIAKDYDSYEDYIEEEEKNDDDGETKYFRISIMADLVRNSIITVMIPMMMMMTMMEFIH